MSDQDPDPSSCLLCDGECDWSCQSDGTPLSIPERITLTVAVLLVLIGTCTTIAMIARLVHPILVRLHWL